MRAWRERIRRNVETWLTGRVIIETYLCERRRAPQLIEVDERENVVTYGGKALALQLLAAQAGTPGIAIAWGTNNTGQTVDDVGLYAEVLRTPLASVSPISRVGDAAVMTIRAKLGKTQGNGHTFREIAFVTSLAPGQGLTIARVATADHAKTDQKFLLAQWQFTLN